MPRSCCIAALYSFGLTMWLSFGLAGSSVSVSHLFLFLPTGEHVCRCAYACVSLRSIAGKKGATFTREDILTAYQAGHGLFSISEIMDLTS